MRIAITGAQSTGKSTLLRYLKKDEDLKGFDLDGYSFSEKESIENSPVFLRKS